MAKKIKFVSWVMFFFGGLTLPTSFHENWHWMLADVIILLSASWLVWISNQESKNVHKQS